MQLEFNEFHLHNRGYPQYSTGGTASVTHALWNPGNFSVRKTTTVSAANEDVYSEGLFPKAELATVPEKK